MVIQMHSDASFWGDVIKDHQLQSGSGVKNGTLPSMSRSGERDTRALQDIDSNTTFDEISSFTGNTPLGILGHSCSQSPERTTRCRPFPGPVAVVHL